MQNYNRLYLSKDVLQGYTSDVDELFGPDDCYKIQDVKTMLLKLTEQADVRISGNSLVIEFLPAPGLYPKARAAQAKSRKPKGRPRKARNSASVAEESLPPRNDPHFLLARNIAHMLLVKIKCDPQRATAVLDALDPGPAEVPLLLDLGEHLAERIESKEAAVVVLRRACTVAPDNAGAHRLLARILHELGRAEDAFQECGKAVELDPNCFLTNLMWVDLREETGRGKRREADFKSALRGDLVIN